MAQRAARRAIAGFARLPGGVQPHRGGRAVRTDGVRGEASDLPRDPGAQGPSQEEHGMSELATDSELESWRMAFRERRSTRGSDCPDEDSLVRFVLGEVHGAEREQLASHLVQCRACGRDWQL